MAALFQLLFIFLSFVTYSASYNATNQEVIALMSIRLALNDPYGALSGWDEFSVDPCGWPLITCNAEKLVTILSVPTRGLSGTLSGKIGDLTNLKQILFQGNNITGAIPLEIGNLSKLDTLDLSINRFTGVIPEILGSLNSLKYLRLNNNSLVGSIPTSLAKLPKLNFLDLSFNNFTGPIPKSPAGTFNIAGNILICKNKTIEGCSGNTSQAPLEVEPLSSPSSSKPKKRRLAVALGVSLSSTTLVLIGLGFLIYWRRNQKKHFILNINDRQEELLMNVGNLKQFTLKELQHATDNFNPKSILGQGGFGNVYRGYLNDGTVVAIKRLKDMSGPTGEAQFKTEVEMISLAVHRNLLRLIGFCATTNERLLVYPYMCNGSVASRLRGKPPLDWNTRKRIALGTARGLLYLHEQCDPKIIHRDVKAANVLLDDYYEAIVGDFGLAKLLDHTDSHVTTAVRGTVGHIAPEYLSTGQSSEKTDVFGFGILLLELITGRRVFEFGKAINQKGAMIDWVKKVQQEKNVEVLVDSSLGTNYDQIEMGEMAQIALLCTQNLPAYRPKMSEIVRMLQGDGLADKWEATQQYHLRSADDNTKSFSRISSFTNTTLKTSKQAEDDADMLAMTIDDEDAHSSDGHAMELSGPR